MEWKVLIMVCLIMFAAASTMVIDLAITLPFSSPSINDLLSFVSLDSGSFQPLGDPVDIDEPPN